MSTINHSAVAQRLTTDRLGSVSPPPGFEGVQRDEGPDDREHETPDRGQGCQEVAEIRILRILQVPPTATPMVSRNLSPRGSFVRPRRGGREAYIYPCEHRGLLGGRSVALSSGRGRSEILDVDDTSVAPVRSPASRRRRPRSWRA